MKKKRKRKSLKRWEAGEVYIDNSKAVEKAVSELDRQNLPAWLAH